MPECLAMRVPKRVSVVSIVICAAALTVVACTSAPSAGRLVFIGTYTGPESKGIYAARFDDRTGALTPATLVAETPNPSFLAASADGRFLFAVNETSTFDPDKSGSVTSFAIDRATGGLSPFGVQSSRGADPVSPDAGRHGPIPGRGELHGRLVRHSARGSGRTFECGERRADARRLRAEPVPSGRSARA